MLDQSPERARAVRVSALKRLTIALPDPIEGKPLVRHHLSAGEAIDVPLPMAKQLLEQGKVEAWREARPDAARAEQPVRLHGNGPRVTGHGSASITNSQPPAHATSAAARPR